MKLLLTLSACGLLAAPALAQGGCDDLLAAFKACRNVNAELPVADVLGDAPDFEVYAEGGRPYRSIYGAQYGEYFGITGFTRADTFPADSSYLEFDLESADGRPLIINAIDLRYSRDEGGPRKLVLRSSLDGFAANLYVDESISDTPELNYAAFATPLEAAQVTFRLYLYDAGLGDYNGLFNLVTFDGNPDEVAIQFKGCIVSPLPVELTSFTASPSGEVAELAWTTASERDNAYFAVELSADGASFEEVGRVDGAGTTGTAQSYDFAHLARRGGAHYFRLRQVDFDGRDSYSEIVAVDLDGTAALQVANTVAERELVVSSAGPVAYRILSLSGDVAQAGQLGGGREPIDVRALAPGMYVLTDGATAVRFVR